VSIDMIDRGAFCRDAAPDGGGGGGGGLRIAEVAQRSGVPAKTIRFYEEVGVVPAPARAANGYRRYGDADARRLRLVGRLRRLGLPLAAAGEVAERAFAAECRTYVRDVSDVLRAQCAEIDRRVAELLALRAELDALAASAQATAAAAPGGRRVAECDSCPVVDGPAPGAGLALAGLAEPAGVR
jgi:DNA-binding transcriptional MerR regulator